MPKLLLIEDNVDLRTALNMVLSQNRFEVSLAATATQAKSAAANEFFDLILLDLHLPDNSGASLCGWLKKNPATAESPIMVISGQADTESQIKLFDSGADDFLRKPFRLDELLARIRARLRTSARQTAGPLVNDTRAHRCYIREAGGARDLNLTPFEYRLLTYFISAGSRPLTREELIAGCRGSEEGISVRNVDLHICSLRKKIGKQYNFIRTVYAVGYSSHFEGAAS